MRHPDASLAAYVEGTATARERATAENHLASCAACRREVKRAKAARAALTALPELDAPGLDPTTIVDAAVAARAARTKPPQAATALPLADLASVATQEWAPAAPGAVSDGVPPVEAPPSDGVEAPAGGPVVADTATDTATDSTAETGQVTDLEAVRQRRDRSRALRLAEAALGAAAIIVAAVLFLGLRNESATDLAARGEASSPQPAPLSGVIDYTPITLTAHAKALAVQITTSGALREAADASQSTSAPLESRGRTDSAFRPVQQEGVTCITRATEGLVRGTRVYEVQQARYLGQPAWIGAFIADAGSPSPELLVVAVPIGQCTPERVQQLIREGLTPVSPSPTG
ncbi:MAG: zf-HC2 domain-containing protein [Actinomycetota bacterium]